MALIWVYLSEYFLINNMVIWKLLIFLKCCHTLIFHYNILFVIRGFVLSRLIIPFTYRMNIFTFYYYYSFLLFISSLFAMPIAWVGLLSLSCLSSLAAFSLLVLGVISSFIRIAILYHYIKPLHQNWSFQKTLLVFMKLSVVLNSIFFHS